MIGDTVPVQCKFIRHETAESLVDAYFKDDYQNDEGRYEGFQAVGGDAIALTKEQILTAVKGQGRWAFAETDTREIHYWSDPSRTSAAGLAFLLGHEVGHLTGKEDPDDWEEEVRADTYGSAVITVLEHIIASRK